MEIRCVKGMQRLKLVSSENNSVVKGLTARAVKGRGAYRDAIGGRVRSGTARR